MTGRGRKPLHEMTLLPLPVVGLMFPEPYEEVAERSKAVNRTLERVSCRLNYAALMALSLLALVVLPKLHISEKSLVTVGEQGFDLVGLLEDG